MIGNLTGKWPGSVCCVGRCGRQEEEVEGSERMLIMNALWGWLETKTDRTD